MNYIPFASFAPPSSAEKRPTSRHRQQQEQEHRSKSSAPAALPLGVLPQPMPSKSSEMVKALTQSMAGLQLFGSSPPPPSSSSMSTPAQSQSQPQPPPANMMRHDRRSVPAPNQNGGGDEKGKTKEAVSGKDINVLTSNGHNDNNADNVVYGELVILGYNGCLPQGEKARRRSRYQLVKRAEANGIKKSKHYSVNQPSTTQAIQDKEQHSISFTLSRSQAIIVEYQRDEETDLFQIGRSSESPIDFVVIDSNIYNDSNNAAAAAAAMARMNANQTQAPFNLPTPLDSPKSTQQSTISRFACRILVDRKPPYTARIYAAGFDSSKNIFLGEKATKWQTDGEIDGLTTNGILMMHPSGSYVSKLTEDGQQQQPNNSSKNYHASIGPASVWREVSVCGEIYSVRETRSSSSRGAKMEAETNVLQDGTLIDLCGATLIWRSAEGLAKSPSKKHLEEMIDQLNASRPQCPVGLNTLQIPRKSASLGSNDDKQPYVYLNCGHVQGQHFWGQVNKRPNARLCPMCFETGPIVKLSMGIEASFCTSSGSPTYAFNPCGHMASESSVKYWSEVLIPHGTNGFHAMCPFCATPLKGGSGYVKLIFQ